MQSDRKIDRPGAAVPPVQRRRVQAIVVATALLFLATIVYGSFLFGEKTLLYKDIGSDSLNIFYPNFVLRSDYLREHGLFSWAFEVGMGQNISSSIGNLVVAPVVWLPKQSIAKGLVYQHLLYLVVAGTVFFAFLRRWNISFEVALLGGALVAFSGYMSLGACWYFHAMEVVAAAILLFCADSAVRGCWPWLVIGVAIMSLLGAFHLYVTAVFLCLFVPVALVLARAPLATSLRAISLLALLAFLGVGLTAVITLDGFMAIRYSPRGTGPTALGRVLSSAPIWGFESPMHYATAVLRVFSTDLAGTGSDFKGWQNYLEAPMSYCGLVCPLLLPQVFVRAAVRQRLVAGLFLLFLILPTVFPWFRYLFWGFQGNYYRAYSLFGVVGSIALAVSCLSRYQRGMTSVPLLLATTVVFILVLFAPIPAMQGIIDPKLRLIVVGLLLTYCLLFILGARLRRQQLFCQVIIALTLIELVCFARRTVDRPVVTKTELLERAGYNDYTVEALRDIKRENTGFFRVTKTFASSPAMYEGLNDALVFGYYGTTSYSSFNNLNYINFLLALDTIPADRLTTYTRYSTGLVGHPLLLAFAAEKYVITKEPESFEQLGQYDPVRQYGEIYTFRNRGFLPLGLPMLQWLRESEFLALSSATRENALLHAAVLNEENAALVADVPRISAEGVVQRINSSSLPETIAKLQSTAMNLRNFGEAQIEGTIQLAGPSIMVFQMPFDPGWHASIDEQPAKTLLVDAGLLGVPTEKGEHRLQLRYTPPLRRTGAVISLVSAALFALLWWRRWPEIAAARVRRAMTD
jgi:hypothetical protein